MKKIASLFLLVVISFSCTTDVTRNNPALEGMKDDVRWRAREMYAELLPNQSLRIIGNTQFETLTLLTNDKVLTTYTLGINNTVTATFEDASNDLVYKTGMNVGGDGIIKITEFDEAKMTVSGEFRFNALNQGNNPAGGPILNFQHGRFYKIPVIPAL